MKLSIAVLSLIALSACSEAPESPGNATPDAAPATVQDQESWSLGYMAAVANPYATDAAIAMLAQGGHAVDAAIAAHAVLGLVEPESSGLGGGGFMVVYEQATQNVRFLDGRETAPAAATADMFMRDGAVMGFLDAWQSGKAVGVPGAVALYKLAHDNYGMLPWATLFEPAIRLASEGFVVPAKMANYLPQMARISNLDENPGAADYFYPGGQPLQAGSILRNPEYAQTLRRIAEEGPQAFYSGDIAEAIASAAQAGPNGGGLTVADIASYQAVEREAICGPWRNLSICSATPPSSGAMQIMVANLYDQLLPENPSQEQRIKAFVDAQRLAYADRDYYFGDPDQVPVPIQQLLDPRYLEYRGNNPAEPGMTPLPGDPTAVLGGATAALWAEDSTVEASGTSHFSIIDNYGNALSATMTVESAFGSGRWAAGFVLNNEMTDFAREYNPTEAESANMIRPGARPRSSMSPTIVLNAEQELYMVTGSPGGNSIPAYTAKSLLGIVDWGMSVQQAVDFPNIIARGESVRVEINVEPGQTLADQLRADGYNIQESDGENSGLHVILVGDEGLIGAADRRREGTVASGFLQ
ncbi:MAG: gamma-glutamyltransferase [Pseudomonadales bacterium]|nr:gamma-glutamyltransferase [Pseudomonadales bacterium]